MSQGSKFPLFPFSDIAGRAAYFEAAYLKQLEVTKALEQRIDALERQVACLMTLGAFVRNKSHRPAFKNAGLWWWLDRNMLGL